MVLGAEWRGNLSMRRPSRWGWLPRFGGACWGSRKWLWGPNDVKKAELDYTRGWVPLAYLPLCACLLSVLPSWWTRMHLYAATTRETGDWAWCWTATLYEYVSYQWGKCHLL